MKSHPKVKFMELNRLGDWRAINNVEVPSEYIDALALRERIIFWGAVALGFILGLML